jgi:hypothetical protein
MNNEFIDKIDKLTQKNGCNISINGYENLKKIKKLNIKITK